MERVTYFILCLSVLLVFNIDKSLERMIMSTDELENHINPEDLREFMNMNRQNNTTPKLGLNDVLGYADSVDITTSLPVPNIVDCFGLGSLSRQLISLFNMKPDSSNTVNTHFYFSSRKMPERVQVMPGPQFGLEWVDFNPHRKTVLIVHGFMSHSNASWVNDMTKAFLTWGDVNVIAVDWSGGGNTWKYWRAVANTRRVGSDTVGFMRQLIKESGARIKDFHFVGHSLGAHIASYVSYHLGKVARITGLDPAQPCFRTYNSTERLDASDADFVDIIHTNGRLLSKIGFGFPDPTGNADFYPNGGMKQPGCDKESKWTQIVPFSLGKLQQAICSHGRAYLLFTESLLTTNCSFRGHIWDLTYEGVNASLEAACDRKGSCSEMGINAIGRDGLPRASGPYFVLTTDKEPYCRNGQQLPSLVTIATPPSREAHVQLWKLYELRYSEVDRSTTSSVEATEWQRHHPQRDLLMDLRSGFRLDRSMRTTTKATEASYADPLDSRNMDEVTTTTEVGWFKRWFGR